MLSDPATAIYTFRPMLPEDLPLFERWVKRPAVAEWWYENARMSSEELYRKMHPRTLGEEGARPFIFSIDGVESGYIQSYLDTEGIYGVPGAAGVDLFIGEERMLHRGFGAFLLRKFVAEQVFSDPNVTACMIDPHAANRIAVRAYEKAGFRTVRDFVAPRDGVKYTLMRMDRQE